MSKHFCEVIIIDESVEGGAAVWGFYTDSTFAFESRLEAALEQVAHEQIGEDPEEFSWGHALELVFQPGMEGLLAQHGLEPAKDGDQRFIVLHNWDDYVLQEDDEEDDETFECGKCEKTCTGERHSSNVGDICDECFGESDNEERLIL